MAIFDWTILNLPLYEERHRTLARELEAWTAQMAANAQAWTTLAPDQACRNYMEQLGRDGWLRLVIHDASGARGRPDLRSVCLAREAFSWLDEMCDIAFSIQGLGASPLAWYGSADQRGEWLDRCGAGQALGTLAMSEPDCGSGLGALTLSAQRGAGGYTLNGSKTWIANATIADFHCVLARTGEGPGALGLSFLLVPRDTPGLTVTAIDMLAPRPLARLDFHDSPLPPQALIGKAGQGFAYAMELLDYYRVSVGAAALGYGRRALQESVQWTRRRPAGNGRLIETQLTSAKLANMMVYQDSTALLVARTAWEFDQGCTQDLALHASITKLHATEQAQRVVDDTVQLFGAAGLVAGSVPERLYRQVRSLRIYEGTSEMQQLMIAAGAARRAQGR
ncbi:acyl-CoA dehydrogenase [Oxalobacteraceae bacterium]|nr:acyl-CoA dehydrogenase [Oxalobacteraceae bacterium]